MSKTAKAKLTKAVDVAAEAALHLLATGSSAAAAAAAAATAAALANPVGGVVIGRPQPPPAVDTGELVVLSHVLSPKVAQEWKNLHSKVG
jgi:Flp pilus assembly protein TadG